MTAEMDIGRPVLVKATFATKSSGENTCGNGKLIELTCSCSEDQCVRTPQGMDLMVQLHTLSPTSPQLTPLFK
jgi:hypothetical protein